MRISDWSSDVCSSDLLNSSKTETAEAHGAIGFLTLPTIARMKVRPWEMMRHYADGARYTWVSPDGTPFVEAPKISGRSEEHTSELQSLMRISYAVFCLKTKKHNQIRRANNPEHNT